MHSTGVGVETWAQNLTSPPISHSDQPQIKPFTQAASQYPQPLFSDNSDPQNRSLNVSLPFFGTQMLNCSSPQLNMHFQQMESLMNTNVFP